jgi:hypothetical protein
MVSGVRFQVSAIMSVISEALTLKYGVSTKAFPGAVSQTDLTPKRHIQLLLSEPLITYPPKFSLTPDT